MRLIICCSTGRIASCCCSDASLGRRRIRRAKSSRLRNTLSASAGTPARRRSNLLSRVSTIEQRREHRRKETQRPRAQQCKPVRIGKRQQLRYRFAEHQRDRRQNKRREINQVRADFIQRAGEHNRRDHCGDVGAGESERQQTIPIRQQLIEHSRARVTAFALRADFQIVGRDQRDFGGCEKRLHD